MLDKMESFKRRESFIYKLAIFYPDSGEFEYKKIANGKDIDIRKDLSAEILSAKIKNWYNWDFSLFTKFDYQKYHEILNALRHYVKETLPVMSLYIQNPSGRVCQNTIMQMRIPSCLYSTHNGA